MSRPRQPVTISPGELRELNDALAALVAERDRLREAAEPLAALPLPVSSDERIEWLTCQQKLRKALAGEAG